MWQPSVRETYGILATTYINETTGPLRLKYPNRMGERELITSLSEVFSSSQRQQLFYKHNFMHSFSFLLIERVRKVVWRGKRSFLSFFAQLYSYSSVAFVIFWILSLRPTLSRFKWAQRVPLGCFVGWYSRRWSLWIVLVCWCRLWWSHCLCRFGLHGARGWCQSLTFPYVLYQFCFQSV